MSDNSYHFVSAKEDVDYIRVVREAPKGTEFILVESRERNTNEVYGSVLLIHNAVLSDERLQGTRVGPSWINREIVEISPKWGHVDGLADEPLYSYRYIASAGRLPGYVKQQIEVLRRIRNPKNIKTTVVYL